MKSLLDRRRLADCYRAVKSSFGLCLIAASPSFGQGRLTLQCRSQSSVSPDCSWPTRDTIAMSCVKACCSLASARSFRQSQTAGSRYLATSEPTRTGTGSSECSTRSNSSGGLPLGTTKPKEPLPRSSISQPHASGYVTLSTGLRCRPVRTILKLCNFSPIKPLRS